MKANGFGWKLQAMIQLTYCNKTEAVQWLPLLSKTSSLQSIELLPILEELSWEHKKANEEAIILHGVRGYQLSCISTTNFNETKYREGESFNEEVYGKRNIS